MTLKTTTAIILVTLMKKNKKNNTLKRINKTDKKLPATDNIRKKGQQAQNETQ